MVYRYASKYSPHKNNYNNPLMLKSSLWRLKLIQYSWKFTKRVTCCGKYNRMRRYMRKRYQRANPLTQRFMSKDEERIWGKFNR